MCWKTKLILLFAGFGIIACGKSQNTIQYNCFQNLLKEPIHIEINACDEIDTAIYTSAIFDSVSFVQLSSDSAAMVSNIDQIVVLDSNLIINDRFGAGIKLFSREGKFINNIGNRGRGQGEYIEPTYVEYSNGKVIVWDQFSKQLLYYDLNGQHIYSREMKYFALACHEFDSNQIVFNSINSDNDESIEDYSLFECDSVSNIISKGMYRKKNTYRSHWANHNFFVQDSILFFHPVYCDTIYSITSQGLIIPEYHIDFGSRGVPEYLRYGHRKEFEREQSRGDYAFLCPDIEITDNHLYFEYARATRIYYCIYSKSSGRTIVFSKWIDSIPLVFQNLNSADCKTFQCERGILS